ncbi:MAG: glycosyltransferase family 2 protein [Nanoarchaeota archaeon]|nr:glycosyltransferase family 2 protein [Nanoarchaeota archaeon]
MTSCAVIAAKDEEKHVGVVVKDTLTYVDEVILVDDGSKDGTKKVAEAAGAKVMRHVVNLGKGAAIRTGCEEAVRRKVSKIVLIDADGQHEPKELPRFLKALDSVDIVYGIRTRRESMPLVLKFGNWFIFQVSKLLYGVKVSDTQCGYRAFNASVWPKIRWESSGYSMESEMLAKAGKQNLKYSTVDISTIYSDKYKGTTVLDGMKIVLNMLWWRLRR